MLRELYTYAWMTPRTLSYTAPSSPSSVSGVLAQPFTPMRSDRPSGASSQSTLFSQISSPSVPAVSHVSSSRPTMLVQLPKKTAKHTHHISTSPPVPSSRNANPTASHSSSGAASTLSSSVPSTSRHVIHYDPGLLDIDVNGKWASYNGIALRQLPAARWIFEARYKIDQKVISGMGGPMKLMEDLAMRTRNLHGTCIYCYTYNIDFGFSHQTLFQCLGAMSNNTNYYYRIYRHAAMAPSGACYSCWTPKNIASFDHPNVKKKECPPDRRSWEDMFRGIPYIVWRTPTIRHAVFKKLGLPDNVHDDFVSVIDFTRWLSLSATAHLPLLTNGYALVWAYSYLYPNSPSTNIHLEIGEFLIF